MNRTFFFCGPLTSSRDTGDILFKDVELDLRENAFVTLVGPSGSGKSTLLRQVTGLVAGTGIKRILKGRRFDTRDLCGWRSRVLLMGQEAPMLLGNVEQNLKFPFSFSNTGERTYSGKRARELMEMTGLGHLNFDRAVETLSGGERHRLALVRALLWEPDVILADEPFSGLDQENARLCYELLKFFSERPGKAVLCVSHDTSLEGPIRMTLVNGHLEMQVR